MQATVPTAGRTPLHATEARGQYVPLDWERQLTKCRALMDVLELVPELPPGVKDGLSDHLEKLLAEEREDAVAVTVLGKLVL